MNIQVKQISSYMALGVALLVGSPQAEGQHIRGDRLSLTAGMGLGIAASRSELDGMSVNLDLVPTGSVNYLKNLHPFLDLRLGAGIQGIIFEGFQLRENVGAFPIEPSISGLSLYGEIVPIYFTNPDRLGYLQADFLFYVGSGVGAIRSFVRERNAPVLSDNDLVKAEFGFENRHQTSSRSLTNVYVPVVIGMEENRTRRSWRFGVETVFNFFLSSNSATSSNVFPGWFQLKFIATKNQYLNIK